MDNVATEPSPGTPLFSDGLEARTHPAEMVLDGARVAYWSYEPLRVTPETRTILVIHGFRGDHHGLLRVADQLPEMRLIMPDLPGFGSSAAFAGAEHSVESYVRFVSDFMAALGLGPDTVLLGHSFGSIVASHFVAAHPGTVSELILVNPIAAPALEGPKGLMTKLAVLYYEAAARLPRRLGHGLLRSQLIVRVMSETMAKTRDKQLRRFVHAQHSAYFSSVRGPGQPAGGVQGFRRRQRRRRRPQPHPSRFADCRGKGRDRRPCRTSTRCWPCCRTAHLDVIPGRRAT